VQVRLVLAALVTSMAAGCIGTAVTVDSGVGGAGGATGGGGGATGGSGGATGGSGGATGGGGASGGGGGSAACAAGALVQALGKDHLLVGGSFADAQQPQAPWDVRYQYLSGGLFDGTAACASCASGCTAGGTSCANAAGGCAWWGCWQYDQDPPGAYVRNFVAAAKSHAEIPMLSYYQLLQSSQLAEGTSEVAAVNDQALLVRYFADWRFVLQQVGTDAALLQLEPDLWGYGEQLNANPHLIPAKVTAANPTDCATQEDSFAGFGRCLVAMARKYAPNAKVGLHASAWGSNIDVSLNTSASLDVAGEANKVADFLVACGAADADFVTVEASDRDAGYYQTVQSRNTWWDATNTALPTFNQHFAWAKALAERVGRPLLWWQLPVGNMGLNNTANHYQDNRVDYFFAHTLQVAQAHGAGFFFGAGAGDQTDPGTDNGNLVSKLNALSTAGGQAPCP
jgi:hypothetical protein